AQSKTNGTMIIVPAASASHQMIHLTKVSDKFTVFITEKPASAMIELIIAVGTKEMTANFATAEGVVNVFWPLDQRQINSAPADAASNVPTATHPDSRSDRPPIKKGVCAATKIAGQTR